MLRPRCDLRGDLLCLAGIHAGIGTRHPIRGIDDHFHVPDTRFEGQFIALHIRNQN